jgi:hypothetical protein
MEPKGVLLRPHDPATFPILRQGHPVHALPLYLFQIHFHIVYA